MAMLFEILADDGSKLGEVLLGHLDRSYRISGGETCEVRQQLAWCKCCLQFVAAEEIPSPSQIREELATARQRALEMAADFARLVAPMPADTNRYADDACAREEARCMRLLKWRELRKSPARCLECASHEIIPVFDASPTHPATGAPISVVWAAHISMATHWHYDVEGIEITGEK